MTTTSTEDPVRWARAAEGCSRCGWPASYYVAPYWEPGTQLCPKCCIALARFYDDRDGWPKQ